jgi:hypothetical protein
MNITRNGKHAKVNIDEWKGLPQIYIFWFMATMEHMKHIQPRVENMGMDEFDVLMGDMICSYNVSS